MKANDLRLGNEVYFNKKIIKVISISNEYINENINIKYIKPIFISKKLIEKSKVKLNVKEVKGENSGNYFTDWYCNSEHEFRIILQSNIDSIGKIGYSIGIESRCEREDMCNYWIHSQNNKHAFFHEYQNLYYIMFGKELTFIE